jgi:hypothetical protein
MTGRVSVYGHVKKDVAPALYFPLSALRGGGSQKYCLCPYSKSTIITAAWVMFLSSNAALLLYHNKISTPFAVTGPD